MIDERQVLAEAVERDTRVDGGEEMQGGSVLEVRYRLNTEAWDGILEHRIKNQVVEVLRRLGDEDEKVVAASGGQYRNKSRTKWRLT